MSGAVTESGVLPAGYPLSAIVGQDDLIEALLVCAVHPAVGGVLVRGERGTAKSTAVRALAPMLGDGLAAAPLVEVPLGATLDRLVGSLDVRAALGGEHRVEAGLLARADGGVLYVDEVNLLGDHLVDALLDAAAAGRVVVERDGVSVVQAARFLLVGTMNPEEGELRPQLLDRFGLGVEVVGPREPSVRAEIVRRRMDFDRDPSAFAERWAGAELELAQRLAAAREIVRSVRLSDAMLERITRTCVSLDLDGVRGDLICAQAAIALAALAGVDEVEPAHVERAAHLALRHRLRRDPLAPPPGPGGEPAIDDALRDSAGDDEGAGSASSTGGAASDTDGHGHGRGTNRGGAPSADARDLPSSDAHQAPEAPSLSSDDGEPSASADAPPAWRPSEDLVPAPRRPDAPPAPGGAPRATTPTAVPSRIPGDALALGRGASARRPSRAERNAGTPPAPAGRAAGGSLAVVDARIANAGEPIAALPTLLAALRGDRQPRAAITGGGRSAHVLLIVDASGSMAARRRLARVKGSVEAALRVAYARRDRVSVVVFAGEGATIVVAPGTPLEHAAAAIADLPAGGRTPLADGLERALAMLAPSTAGRVGRPETAHNGQLSRGAALPADGRARLVLLLTDGRAADPEGRAARALAQIVDAADRTVVVDLEDGRARLGLAAELAARAGADLTRLVTPNHAAPRRSAA